MSAYYNKHVMRLTVPWRLNLPPSWTYLVLTSFFRVFMAVSFFQRLCPPSLPPVSGASPSSREQGRGRQPRGRSGSLVVASGSPACAFLSSRAQQPAAPNPRGRGAPCLALNFCQDRAGFCGVGVEGWGGVRRGTPGRAPPRARPPPPASRAVPARARPQRSESPRGSSYPRGAFSSLRCDSSLGARPPGARFRRAGARRALLLFWGRQGQGAVTSVRARRPRLPARSPAPRPAPRPPAWCCWPGPGRRAAGRAACPQSHRPHLGTRRPGRTQLTTRSTRTSRVCPTPAASPRTTPSTLTEMRRSTAR